MQVHVFISHSWKYSGHYEKLAEWIFDEHWLVSGQKVRFLDYSVPKSHPIHDAANDAHLRDAIFDQISRSHVVVIPTGMYAYYSKWIRKEIEGANRYRKPILAVNPWAQERKASVVVNASSDAASWRSDSVVSKIWALYRNAR